MSRKQKLSQTDTKIDSSAGQTRRMKDALLEELAKYPIIQIACQRTGIGRSTFYKWKKRDEKFSEIASMAIAEGKKFTNEMAESQLIKAIGNGNMTGIIYWLKNNHADYTDKVRYEHSHEYHIDEFTEEQSSAVARALANIGLANTLKRDGFTYTKEEAEEAERIRIIRETRREKRDKEYMESIRMPKNTFAETTYEKDAPNAPKKERMVKISEALKEKPPVDLDVNGRGEVDMTDIVIRPGMTASEINRQFMDRTIRREREEQKRLRGE